jgi:hypothetical protein
MFPYPRLCVACQVSIGAKTRAGETTPMIRAQTIRKAAGSIVALCLVIGMPTLSEAAWILWERELQKERPGSDVIRPIESYDSSADCQRGLAELAIDPTNTIKVSLRTIPRRSMRIASCVTNTIYLATQESAFNFSKRAQASRQSLGSRIPIAVSLIGSICVALEHGSDRGERPRADRSTAWR